MMLSSPCGTHNIDQSVTLCSYYTLYEVERNHTSDTTSSPYIEENGVSKPFFEHNVTVAAPKLEMRTVSEW